MRALADDRDVGIRHRQDARLQRDLLAGQAPWIAAAIGPLAVTENPCADVLQAHVPEQRGSQFGLAANLGLLLLGERARLVEDLGGDLIAPDVAHERGEADPRSL